MSIVMIAALDRRGAIGSKGQLLFRIAADMRHFRALTTGNTLIMGRKTFESLPGALPDRRNIVLSRRGVKAPGTECAADLGRALEMAAHGPGDTYIIGGGDVYAQALPYADRLQLTVVGAYGIEPDTFFPPFDADGFTVTHLEHVAGTPGLTFVTLDRKRQ